MKLATPPEAKPLLANSWSCDPWSALCYFPFSPRGSLGLPAWQLSDAYTPIQPEGPGRGRTTHSFPSSQALDAHTDSPVIPVLFAFRISNFFIIFFPMRPWVLSILLSPLGMCVQSKHLLTASFWILRRIFIEFLLHCFLPLSINYPVSSSRSPSPNSRFFVCMKTPWIYLHLPCNLTLVVFHSWHAPVTAWYQRTV